MTAYVSFAQFRGDWRNDGKGRVVKCRHCGYSLRAFIPVTDAYCPNGHRMAVLTETPRGASVRAADMGAKLAPRSAYSEHDGAARVAVGG